MPVVPRAHTPRTQTTGAPALGVPAPRIPAPRTRRREAAEAIPLGSLTQREHRVDTGCPACGSTRLTHLSMTLTDGTPVQFTSCHRCEHKTWQHRGTGLDVTDVLERTRKPA